MCTKINSVHWIVTFKLIFLQVQIVNEEFLESPLFWDIDLFSIVVLRSSIQVGRTTFNWAPYHVSGISKQIHQEYSIKDIQTNYCC